MRTIPTPPWALLLAGGDGRRLRPLTRQIAGDPRPKQFCPIFDGETLLDRTRRRADLLTRLDHQVVVVTRTHEPYYATLTRELAPDRLVVQPSNAGTAAGIFYPLLRIRQLGGNVPVAIFPSDHYVSDDGVFVGAVAHAVEVARQRRDLIVLLGVEASAPETEYGWIEPDPLPLPIPGEPAFPIRRFWEKPSVRLAERLFERGALWNSFVMVGWVETLLALVARNAPELAAAFEPLARALGTPSEADIADHVYGRLSEPLGFSERVLAPARDGLVTVRVKGVEWSDWGHPQRVIATMRRTGWEPTWLGRVELASAG
jgi:mannose-1-phosphate guanylyltransferase